MRTAITAVWAVIVCTFFVQGANGLQTDLISLKADSVFTSTVIGLMMAGYYAGYVIAPLVGRSVIGRFGHVKVFVLSMALPAVVILVQPLTVTAPLWTLFRALSGFALSMSYVAVESWINDRVGNELRGRVFSVYMFSQMAGMTLAQGLIGFGTGYVMFALAAMLFLVAAAPIVIARRTAPSGAPPAPLALTELFKVSPLGAGATVLAGLSWAILFTFGPVYAKRIGLDMTGIGLFMAIAMAAGGALQVPAGWLADIAGRRPVLALMFAGGCVANVFGVVAQGPLVFVAAALSGAFIFPIYAVSAATVNDGIAPETRVAAAAGLVLLFGIGSLFGPLVCGAVMGVMGPSGFFVLLAATMATGLVCAWWFRRQPVPRF